MTGLAKLSHLAFAAALGLAPISATAQPDDGLVYSHDGGAAVDAAIVKARESLPIFWRKFDARQHAPAYDAFMLKVKLPAKKIETEAIWVDVVSRKGEQIEGVVTEDAVYIPGLKAGSRIKVDPASVIDWSYNKNNKVYGQFTTRALMDDATPAQRAEALAALAPTPLEIESR